MNHFEGFKPVHSPPVDQGADKRELSLEEYKRYSKLLQTYVNKRRELGEYRRKNEAVLSDPDVYKESLLLDREINHAHEDLKDAAKTLGRNEYDVIIDTLRQEGNLSAQFGLPEFCVLTAEDLWWSSYAMDIERFKLADGNIRPLRENKQIPIGMNQGSTHIGYDEVMIVFHSNLHTGKLMHENEYILQEPDRFARESRRRLLAEEIGGRLLYIRDGPKFHAHTISIHGVVIKKSELERTASVIREHPQKFRLGSEFYTSQEVEQNGKKFSENLDESFKKIGHYGSRDEIAEEMAEQIDNAYGKKFGDIARTEYETWKNNNPNYY